MKLVAPSEDVKRRVAAAIPEARPGLPASFIFSMAKCGSTMLNRAVGQINAEAGIPDTNLPGVFFRLGVSPASWAKMDLRSFFADGHCHRGFRYLPHSLDQHKLLQQRKSVLLLRDLRDAATSHYFSKLHEHPVPGGGQGALAEQFVRDREALAAKSIDDHVVERARIFTKHWRHYMSVLPKDPALVRVYRYEDVIFRKRDFLTELYAFLEIDVSPEIIERAAAEVDVFPEKENVSSRVRVVKPGNYLEKLQPATIETLNAENREFLTAHGYL
jgi:Sulfotransferase domain